MAGRDRSGGTEVAGERRQSGLWAETRAPTLHPKHMHRHTCTHIQMSGVAKSPGEGTSFQYGLLPGAPDAATGRPPLREPLICDKSCPCILIILLQLQNPIPTWPNWLHATFSLVYQNTFVWRSEFVCNFFFLQMHLSQIIRVYYYVAASVYSPGFNIGNKDIKVKFLFQRFIAWSLPLKEPVWLKLRPP